MIKILLLIIGSFLIACGAMFIYDSFKKDSRFKTKEEQRIQRQYNLKGLLFSGLIFLFMGIAIVILTSIFIY